MDLLFGCVYCIFFFLTKECSNQESLHEGTTVCSVTYIFGGTRRAVNKLEPLRAGQCTCPPLSLPGLAQLGPQAGSQAGTGLLPCNTEPVLLFGGVVVRIKMHSVVSHSSKPSIHASCYCYPQHQLFLARVVASGEALGSGSEKDLPGAEGRWV